MARRGLLPYSSSLPLALVPVLGRVVLQHLRAGHCLEDVARLAAVTEVALAVLPGGHFRDSLFAPAAPVLATDVIIPGSLGAYPLEVDVAREEQVPLGDPPPWPSLPRLPIAPRAEEPRPRPPSPADRRRGRDKTSIQGCCSGVGARTQDQQETNESAGTWGSCHTRVNKIVRWGRLGGSVWSLAVGWCCALRSATANRNTDRKAQSRPAAGGGTSESTVLSPPLHLSFSVELAGRGCAPPVMGKSSRRRKRNRDQNDGLAEVRFSLSKPCNRLLCT